MSISEIKLEFNKPKVIPSLEEWNPDLERQSTDGIIIHSMLENINGKCASDFLDDLGLSAHAFIHSDGTIELGQDESKVAYHAGRSKWNGFNGLNGNFLGIEMLVSNKHLKNTPFKGGNYPKFKYIIDNQDWCSAKQFDSLIYLLRLWKDKYNIKDKNIVGHSQVAGDDVRGFGKGKIDPGKMFPMDLVKKHL